MTVIGTDDGLVPVPIPVKSFRHGVAERYEVVIDFAKHQPGDRITLRNAAPKNTISFTNTDKAMQFLVTDEPFDGTDNEIPAQLNPNQPTMLLKASDATITRRMDFVRKNGLWTINGRTWDDVVRSRFREVAAARGRRRGDLGAAQPVGRLAPPGAHPPDRLQDPQPQRPAAAAARARPQGHRVPRRERDGPAADQVRRGHRQVHGALPQPDPRGPRHDDPVRGRR